MQTRTQSDISGATMIITCWNHAGLQQRHTPGWCMHLHQSVLPVPHRRKLHPLIITLQRLSLFPVKCEHTRTVAGTSAVSILSIFPVITGTRLCERDCNTELWLSADSCPHFAPCCCTLSKEEISEVKRSVFACSLLRQTSSETRSSTWRRGSTAA